jgi:hypothetical protein
MPLLQIIIASTRDGRKGDAVGRWAEARARAFFAKMFAGDGTFAPGDLQDKAAAAMLDELKRWTGALRTLRAGS